jgi:AcrR family transcriptional regulator
MSGLRERKRRRTVAAIHHAGLKLFAERGYGAVTVADIAEAAEVSRATVFTYFPAKEDIVLGDTRAAIDSLRSALADSDEPVVPTVRSWLRTLAGWIDPDIVLMRRLGDDVPAVGAARSRVQRDIERVIAEALAHEIDAPDPLPTRLVAGALTSAIAVVEAEAAARFADGGGPLDPAEVDALFDTAVAFVDAGLERVLSGTSPEPGRDTG